MQNSEGRHLSYHSVGLQNHYPPQHKVDVHTYVGRNYMSKFISVVFSHNQYGGRRQCVCLTSINDPPRTCVMCIGYSRTPWYFGLAIPYQSCAAVTTVFSPSNRCHTLSATASDFMLMTHFLMNMAKEKNR